jgi:hypothetical protein
MSRDASRKPHGRTACVLAGAGFGLDIESVNSNLQTTDTQSSAPALIVKRNVSYELR